MALCVNSAISIMYGLTEQFTGNGGIHGGYGIRHIFRNSNR